MRVEEFDYHLPPELIAQSAVEPRDSARLLVLERASGRISHHLFRDLIDFLRPEDVLVVNDTRVLPARLFGIKRDTGGRVEFVLLHRAGGEDLWEVLVRPGRRLPPGAVVLFYADGQTGEGWHGLKESLVPPELEATVLERTPSGGRIVRFYWNKERCFEEVLAGIGRVPLPPYIHSQLADPERYQTVYAKHLGSAAAPTAGLHFTPSLLADLKRHGVAVVSITLHVGLGTFRPVQVDEVEEHVMHAESYQVSPEAAEMINARRNSGGRVVAVGTTVARTLESVADLNGRITAGSGWTDIFIYPGYRFRAVDALITNFHLPRSTLLMLVSAFAGRERVLAAYQEAIRLRYRFYSFGDAMLIL